MAGNTYYDRMIPITNLLNLSVSFNRTSAFPLDARGYFSNVEDAKAAAATAREIGSDESVYYYGMPITVFNSDGVASLYIIQGDGTLKHCANAMLPDNKSIEIISSGEAGKEDIIQMKNFGKEYYKFHAADVIVEGDQWVYPSDMPDTTAYDEGTYCKTVNNGWYILNSSKVWEHTENEPHYIPWYELTQGWKAGLEPKVIANGDDYAIAWYEPSDITVEGLAKAIETLRENVNTLSDRVDTLEEDKLTPDDDTIKKTEVGAIYVNEIPISKVRDLDSVVYWHHDM